MRIFLADIVERARQQNRRQAREHHGWQHLCEQIALLLVKYLRIADGERDRSLAHAAGHNRDHDEEERVVGAETQHNADNRTDDASYDRSSSQRDEYLEEALDENATVHTKDATDDDAGYKQVQKVRVLREFRDRSQDRGRQQMMEGKERR